jgi:hypothetical protein
MRQDKPMLMLVLAVTLLLPAASGQARMADFAAHEAVMDSLIQIPPRFRGDWLRSKGLKDPFVFGTGSPESTGLRLVGKYGRGPAREVTGQGSLLFLSNGSAVAVFNIADPGRPVLLTEIQARSIVSQSIVRNGLLYIGDYAELSIWDISDPTRPGQLSVIPYGMRDFALSDSLLAFTQQDTFRVYSVADPANPRELGILPDSGTVRTASGGRFILNSQQDIVYIIDCSDPARPQRRGSYPGYTFGLAARGDICCAAVYWHSGQQNFRFDVLDISDPDNIRRIGQLAEVGGYDIHLDGPLAFVSGYQGSGFEFTIVSIADSTRPMRVGQCWTPGENEGVWGSFTLDRAYVADRFRGLTVINTSDLNNPVIDTSMYYGGVSLDVDVSGDLACVASDGYGMVLLDVSSPSQPVQLGAIDTTRKVVSHAVALADSFAYMGYSPSLGNFKTIDISDPSRPVRAGGVNLFNWPEAMVLRDGFAYVAESNRFEVVNVARPREPVLVGSCALPGTPLKLTLGDSVAYAATFGVQCINIVNPDNPYVAGVYSTRVSGMDIADTVLYGAGPYTGLIALSIADPVIPRLLDSLHLSDTLWWNDVVVVDTLAYVGGERLWAVNIADPQNLRLVPGISWTPPYLIRRLIYAAPYLYAACYEAGVAILEIVPTGVAEKGGASRVKEVLRILPSPTRGRMAVRLGVEAGSWAIRDVTGRMVDSGVVSPAQETLMLELGGWPAGVYVLELTTPAGKVRGKFVKQ